jgi:hypothetical protein
MLACVGGHLDLPSDGHGASAMAVAGELVAGTLEYDGGRQVTVYLPP